MKYEWAKMSLWDITNEIKQLTDKEPVDATSGLPFLMQEVGELAQAISVENGTLVKLLDEPAYMEAVDTIINALMMYYLTKGGFDHLQENIESKLIKWQQKQEKKLASA